MRKLEFYRRNLPNVENRIERRATKEKEKKYFNDDNYLLLSIFTYM
jgi:hypothetical protein